jgi:carboxyl-terminal processing protease
MIAKLNYGLIMKKIFLLIILFLTSGIFAQTDHTQHAVIDSNLVLQPEPYHSKVNQVITSILTKYHYKKTDLNDSLSVLIFDEYIKSLDNGKLYFLKSDIEEFQKYRLVIDDYLNEGNETFAFDVFNRYKVRLNERMTYILHRLNEEFDFTIDEYYVPDRKDEDWAKTKTELDEIWRKRLKNDALNKKLANDPWEKISVDLKKRYQSFHKVILQYKPEDVFQLYMNTFASVIDPHSNYFSPVTSENFNITMSRSLEGIGAQLSTIDDYTTVANIIPGGPADKSKKLFEKDRIVSVGQDTDGEMVDVIGWRLDDVVQLIRGKKGTTVRLEILRADKTPDMPTETIIIVRDKVTLEEQSAKSEILYLNENGTTFKIGVLDIPAFYIDFKARSEGDANYKSTTRDVKKLLMDLKQENVDGIIVDLRSNGGGSLQEAIELTGLFIKDGPVVQVKDSRGIVEVDKDPDASIFYEGPMAVLLNRYSASASEIFAAAIQDYGRGIIIGEQTFGKGTVQNLLELNRMIRLGDAELGNVKLTIAKYYRINGSSTQKIGVIPDIEFPSVMDRDDFGEASYPSSLDWDLINSAEYKEYDNLKPLIPKLTENYKKRIADNIEFKYMLEDMQEYKVNKLKKSFSLNEEVRKDEREKNESKRKLREEMRQKESDIKVVNKNEVSPEESEVDDAQLRESGRILSDLIVLKFG